MSRRARGLVTFLSGLLLALGGCASMAPPDAPLQAVVSNPIAQPVAGPEAPATTLTSASPVRLQTPDAAPAAAAAPEAPPPRLSAADLRRLLPDLEFLGERSDLWQRVREGFALAALDDRELVTRWEQWYATRPDYVRRMTERGGRYLFHIVEEVQKREMPTELALLPFIESAFNPQALSSARASGMWQFMPATGRDFDLRQNIFRDDRRDVLASTRAALDYLQRLHRQFGDWHLALAAYNWGQGNVQRAIARNQRDGLPTNYASLRMPDETRNYVPKLLAVKNLVARPAAFGLSLLALENHPFFATVPIERDIDVALAARLAGVTLEEFQAMNPQLNKPVILAAGTPQVLLPWDNAQQFAAALDLHDGPLATWTAWVVPRTLRPGEAAAKVGMAEDRLREVNRIPPRMLVQAGSTLLVSRAGHATADVTGQVADHGAMVLRPEAPPLRRMTFKAGQRGDSVAAVARRFGVTAQQVAQTNGVAAHASFKPGQSIVVMVPPHASRRAATAPGQRKAKPASSQRQTKR